MQLETATCRNIGVLASLCMLAATAAQKNDPTNPCHAYGHHPSLQPLVLVSSMPPFMEGVADEQ